MKLDGMSQSLKGGSGQVGWQFGPYGCEISEQCHIENTPTRLGLYREAVVLSPHLQAAVNHISK